MRVLVPLSRKWELVGYGDFGGFDGYANTQWQLLGGINFKISKLVVAKVGYRYIDVEYIKNELNQDLAFGGFYLEPASGSELPQAAPAVSTIRRITPAQRRGGPAGARRSAPAPPPAPPHPAP